MVSADACEDFSRIRRWTVEYQSSATSEALRGKTPLARGSGCCWQQDLSIQGRPRGLFRLSENAKRGIV